MSTCLVIALVLAQAQPAAAPSARPDEVLRRAVNEYAYGNYETAIAQLKALLYPMQLVSDAQVLEARRYLALSYYLTDKRDLMTEELEKLLYLEPDYHLDPFSIPPSIIDAFEKIRERMKPQLDAIRQRRADQRIEESQERPGTLRIVERTIVERSELATFAPFGIGQFQNGQTGWGVFFAATQTLLLGVNVGSYLYLLFGVGNGYDQAEHGSTVRALTVAQTASLALFGMSWSLGVLHARLYFVPTVEGPPVVRDGGPGLPAPAGPGPGLIFGLDF